MGRQSGAKHSGARGKIQPLDVAKELNAGDELDIADLCREHAEKAIDTLVIAMNPGKRKVAWPTRIKAATEILDRAAGKPATQDVQKESTGLTVNIMLGPGAPAERVEFDVTELKDNVPEVEEGGNAGTIDLHGDGGSVVVRVPE